MERKNLATATGVRLPSVPLKRLTGLNAAFFENRRVPRGIGSLRVDFT
ncbi:MAG: hypothetical protein HY894_03485 [Deltaproteobacteria bacterium]|nr:hypothetical protein [Deltaproteobacteria bacterium]